MKELFLNKSPDWGDGPWNQEPDRVEWIDNTGLSCLVERYGRLGTLNGYVGVDSTHPLFQKDYHNWRGDFRAHGGITWASFFNKEDASHFVEHNKKIRLWWIGFDCSHGFDCIPLYQNKFFGGIGADIQNYRSLSYVKKECLFLAKQIATSDYTCFGNGIVINNQLIWGT